MARPRSLEKEQSSRSSSNKPAGRSFYFLTLFPELLKPVLEVSLLGKAQDKGLVSFNPVQIRDFSKDKHKTVDDTPFGGGEGMVMRADVLYAAWQHARALATNEGGAVRTVMLSPQGKLLTQDLAKELLNFSSLILVCGHYEGVDERFIETCVDMEISIGDYVLTGGELPALVLADAVCRLIPGVVGNERSLSEESLEGGLLKYPQYTRPREFNGLTVPDVLLSGDHAKIAAWRKQQMLERTRSKRPDLFVRP
ncbi:MAG: tRNA (guanosine(37)-N1)-methyltransferase TrmD [Bdellovibrionota bacterium]